MASRIFSRTSSKLSPWVMHPGKKGAEATYPPSGALLIKTVYCNSDSMGLFYFTDDLLSFTLPSVHLPAVWPSARGFVFLGLKFPLVEHALCNILLHKTLIRN